MLRVRTTRTTEEVSGQIGRKHFLMYFFFKLPADQKAISPTNHRWGRHFYRKKTLKQSRPPLPIKFPLISNPRKKSNV